VLSEAVVLELEVTSDFSDALELGDLGLLFFDLDVQLPHGVGVSRDSLFIVDAVLL